MAVEYTSFKDSPRARARAKRLSDSSTSSSPPAKLRRPSLFNLFRAAIFVLVILWSIIVLAIAVHFEGILVSSELTHFVPFAIFVSTASLLIILALLVCSPLRQRNPISTRIELSALALCGVLWLALGVFLGISEAAEADVECFSADSSDSDPIDVPNFSTETYHAQYRVLEAFSLFNTVLVWGFVLFLLILVLRERFRGHDKVWVYPVPMYPWFGQGSNKKNTRDYRLPAPAVAKDTRRRPTTSSRRQAEKGATQAQAPGPAPALARDGSKYRNSAFWVWIEKPRSVPAAHTRDRRQDATRRSPTTRK